MKKISTTLLAITLCISAAMSQNAVMTLTTTNDVGSSITFYLAAKKANTQIQVDFGDGTLVNKTIATYSTKINGNLAGSQTIKVYGTGIINLSCLSLKLTALDVSMNNELQTLICSNNQLTTLDVNKNTALKSLTCNDNQLTALNLDTALTYLDCSFNQLSSVNINEATELTTLACSNNQLTTLDLTKNTWLDFIYLSNNQLTELDVSKNTLLKTLYCESNQLDTLDITKNVLLKGLWCSFNQLQTIDVTQNTKLVNLLFKRNQISKLDITNNTALRYLDCSENRLIALDVSKNIALTVLLCGKNQLTFATLPLKQPQMITYYYDPQGPISIPKTLSTGDELDLSNQLSINGETTVYYWRTKSGTNLIQETDYTISDGKTVFIKAQVDSVYCEMTNATFPYFDLYGLRTTCTKISPGSATAIDDLQTNGLEIYTYNKILYINSSHNAQLSVFDTNGRRLICKPLQIGVNNIQLKNSGVYLVKITGIRRSVTQKIYI